jgi:small subunit ribosomal protein S3
MLEQDIKIRRYLKIKLREALVDRIDIERSRNTVTVNIHAAKPGVIIGRGGAGVETLRKHITRTHLPRKTNLNINIQEVRQPSLSAAIMVQNIIDELEKRTAFRRLLKQTVGRVMRDGAKGVKVMIKGRLNGSEIARSEMLAEGLIPLHTLRANIDFSRGAAQMAYGKIGVKVWIYKGEVFDKKQGK